MQRAYASLSFLVLASASCAEGHPAEPVETVDVTFSTSGTGGLGSTATSLDSTSASTTDGPTAGSSDSSGDSTIAGTTAAPTGGSSDGSGSTTGEESLGPYPDLALGPYPSLLTMATDSMISNAESLDTSTTYSHSAGQGYLLQAIGELLWDARNHELDRRDELIDAALGEIAELEASADQVLGGGPGFGLDEAWDAFGDGSTNPAFTAYTWQSGMVALGVAKIARVLVDARHPQAAAVLDFGVGLVERWDEHFTEVTDGGYWWYSAEPSDAIATHNTSALIAMASQILSESGADAGLDERPPLAADLLWARMSGNPTAGYSWNYADDGYPVAQRRPEDVSHALVTLQLMREAGERGWWGDSQLQGVAATLTQNMWSGHPARLHGFVDGSAAAGTSEWSWSRAAVIGYAAHGDAPGGSPAVFEYGRSLLFSSYLSRFERAFQGSTIDSARTLAVALFLSHRPDGFEDGSAWEMVAGPGDDAVPDQAGGVRFYTVDWAAPADAAYGITLPGRAATAANANFLVDLEDDFAGEVAVSITYSAATAGDVAQWDGAAYQTLGSAAATLDEDGTRRWMRTTFTLDSDRFDYQDGVVGTNVLLRASSDTIAIHRIEATPF